MLRRNDIIMFFFWTFYVSGTVWRDQRVNERVDELRPYKALFSEPKSTSTTQFEIHFPSSVDIFKTIFNKKRKKNHLK